MNTIKIVSLLFFVMCNNIFATNLETETKKDKKTTKSFMISLKIVVWRA